MRNILLIDFEAPLALSSAHRSSVKEDDSLIVYTRRQTDRQTYVVTALSLASNIQTREM